VKPANAFRVTNAMSYALRIKGGASPTFDTEEEAVARAREILQTHPDAELDIWDTTTGKPAAPAGSKAWRDELARKVGF
jgi:hypothetical protein